MSYVIQVRGLDSLAENAAVVAAFNGLITALHGGCAHKVDAGGTVIDGKKYTADEVSPHGTRLGDQW